MNESFDVYAFDHWQPCLRKWIDLQKLVNPQFTINALATKLGIKARSHVYRLLQEAGKNLPSRLATTVGAVMGLQGSELEYWLAMVDLNRSKTPEERGLHFGRMQKLVPHNNQHDLESRQYEYLSVWFLPVLRELAPMTSWKGDFKRMGQSLTPAITESQARKGIELLLELGLLKNHSGGRYLQTDALVTSRPGIQSIAAIAFQKSMITIASQALDSIPDDKREISTMTFSIPESSIPKVQTKMRLLLQSIAKESLTTQDLHNCVYQINLQAFPVANILQQKRSK